MVQINKRQAATLATLTRDAAFSDENWELDETNMEGVICLREYQVERESGELRDVLIASDGQAVALADGLAPTVLLTSDGPPTPD